VFEVSGLRWLHILWVDEGQVEERILERFKMVEAVSVSCRLPAKCIIEIQEREPLIVWRDSSEGGALWWIDADGVVFGALGPLPQAWEVHGPIPLNESKQLRNDARSALVELLSLESPIANTVYYEPQVGFQYLDDRGRHIVLGQGSGIRERLRVCDTLLADLERRKVVPRVVDVRFLEAPYYVVAGG
jgi:cell division septal protein FtsQ